MSRWPLIVTLSIAASSAAASLPPHAHVIAVAPGDDLLAVMDSITDAGPSNRYLLALSAGTYDLGIRTLAGKPYVDIQGAGAAVTAVQNTGATVLSVASFSEISDVTLREGGTARIGVPIVKSEGLANAGVLRRATVDASRRTLGTPAVTVYGRASLESVTMIGHRGIDLQPGSLVVIDDCVIEAIQQGIAIFGDTSVTVNASSITTGTHEVVYSPYTTVDGSLTMLNSVITPANYLVTNKSPGFSIKLYDCTVNAPGATLYSVGPLVCHGVRSSLGLEYGYACEP